MTAPFDIPLRPFPDSDCVLRRKHLLTDPWLAGKVNRMRRLREHAAYIDEHCQELTVTLDNPPGPVFDVGPGPGEFLEIARAMGHEVYGVDAVTGKGGMGDHYLAYSSLMTSVQKIPVFYQGFEGWLCDNHIPIHETVLFVNSRGSIEQAFAEYMDGPPHHEHHDCRQLAWRVTAGLAEIFEQMFFRIFRMLRQGGAFLIHANGAANSADYDRLIRKAAETQPGMDLVKQQGLTLHKWRKYGREIGRQGK